MEQQLNQEQIEAKIEKIISLFKAEFAPLTLAETKDLFAMMADRCMQDAIVR